jgi:hypothetical protein
MSGIFHVVISYEDSLEAHSKWYDWRSEIYSQKICNGIAYLPSSFNQAKVNVDYTFRCS